MDTRRVHVFRDTGYTTLLTDRRICECGDLESAPVHEMPETPEAAKAIDARRLGEAE